VEVLTVSCYENSKPVQEKELTGDCRARITVVEALGWNFARMT